MNEPVRVRIAASPQLLHDAMVQQLHGFGVEITDSDPSLVAVVTPDHTRDVHSKIIIVLGDSADGDVHVLIEGEPAHDRAVDAAGLHDLVLDLAHHVTHAVPTVVPPRAPASDTPNKLEL